MGGDGELTSLFQNTSFQAMGSVLNKELVSSTDRRFL